MPTASSSSRLWAPVANFSTRLDALAFRSIVDLAFAFLFCLLTFAFLLVQERLDERVQALGHGVGAEIAEFVAEVPHRHDGLGHRAVAARAPDIRKEPAYEFAGVLR